MKTYDISNDDLLLISNRIIDTMFNELQYHSGAFDKELSFETELPEPLSETHFYCYGEIVRSPMKYRRPDQEPIEDVYPSIHLEPVRVWVNDNEEAILPLDIEKIESEINYLIQK